MCRDRVCEETGWGWSVGFGFVFIGEKGLREGDGKLGIRNVGNAYYAWCGKDCLMFLYSMTLMKTVHYVFDK